MKWYTWLLLAGFGYLVYSGASKVLQLGEKAKPYLSLIKSAAAQYSIPWFMMAIEIEAESGFDPSAVSPAGAQGIAQFMPATAAGLGIDPFDPNQAIPAMAQYLGQIRDYLTSSLGSVTWSQVLAGYNWGMGAVEKAVKTYGADWLSHAPAETQNYVTKIIAATGVL